MILWHMGAAALIVYVTLGRRRIDYRWILAGAVVPDVVDLGGRRLAHSILAVVAVAIVIVVSTRGERRLAWFGLAVGWLTHLVADGMWNSPRTFLWPAFGTRFAADSAEPYSWDLFADPAAHWTTWAGEVVGASILWWFWVAFELGRDGRFRRWLRDGYLRP